MFARATRVSIVAGVIAISVACGGSKEPSTRSSEPSAPGATPAEQRVDPATAGEIHGVVTFEGAVPRNEPIKMNSDPVCETEATVPQFQDTYIVGDDGKTLGNVFVYVKEGLGNYIYDTPTQPVTIDQKGCRYHPHVVGIRVGQPLDVINSDPTLHNVHALPKGNQEFNTGQPVQGMKMTHTFTSREVMVPFKCDVHSWMTAYVGVLDHPYFAVTEKDGRFDLKTLPPGTYTIEAVHEKLGRTTQQVTVAPKETKAITFTFRATGGTPTE